MPSPEHGAVDLTDFLARVFSSTPRKSIRHNKWRISFFYGESFRGPVGNMHCLEWTVVARANGVAEDQLPDLTTGGEPVLAKFGETTVVSWVGQHLDELHLVLERSFRDNIFSEVLHQ